MKKNILIQARLSSSRFPKKMLHKLSCLSLVEYVYKRCKFSYEADGVMVITSNEASDDELYNICLKKQIPVYRGELNDVLKRYIDAAEENQVDIICRVCGDSPFVDIEAVDKMFTAFDSNQNLEYISTDNCLNGFMSEVFTLDLLKKVYNLELTVSQKEHVTKYVRDNLSKYNTEKLDLNLRAEELEKYTLTIDYPKDLEIAKKIVQDLNKIDFKSSEIINILKKMEKNEL